MGKLQKRLGLSRKDGISKTLKSLRGNVNFSGTDDEIQKLLSEIPDKCSIFEMIRNLPPPPMAEVPVLPSSDKASKKYTLVLDMDETLIHARQIEDEEGGEEEGFLINIPISPFITKKAVVRKRPYLDYFLREISKEWEVVVFTASRESYARKILDVLDPKGNMISHRVYGDCCYVYFGNSSRRAHYIKNLNILGRNLSRTVLVDNSIEAFGFQINNGFLIKTWLNDTHDDWLLRLLDILKKISSKNLDVQEFMKSHYRVHDLIYGPNP